MKSKDFTKTQIISKTSRVATAEETEKLIAKIIRLVKKDDVKLEEKGIDITLIKDNNEEIEVYENFKKNLVNITRMDLIDSKGRTAVLYAITNVFIGAEKFQDDSEAHTFYTELYQEYPNGNIEDITQDDIIEFTN